MRDKVFISYSHKDREWLDRLLVHLKPLMRDQQIDIWYDTRIESGAKWNDEIENALQSTKVAVLLISPDFLASDFIANKELPALLQAAEQDDVIILPVILRPSSWSLHPFLANIQAVNDPNQPLSSLLEKPAEIDNIFVKLSYRILNEFEKAPVHVYQSVKTPAIEKSETSKESDGTKIWFSDFLHPDPVSVRLAVIAFQNGERNFKVEWHEENRRHLDTLIDLFDQAKNYRNEASVFSRYSSSVVAKFVKSAHWHTIQDYQNTTTGIEKRIPLLLEGMKGSYSLGYEGEIALANYLTLANFNLHTDIVFTLGYEPVFEKYYPPEWHGFHTRENILSQKELSILFHEDDPFYSARLWKISGGDIGKYVSKESKYPYIYVRGPKPMLIDACCEDAYYHDSDNRDVYRMSKLAKLELEFKYLIPQIEWKSIDTTIVIPYHGDFDIFVIKGASGNELHVKNEWLYLHDQKEYYRRRKSGLYGLAEDDKLTDEEVKEIYGLDDIWGSNNE